MACPARARLLKIKNAFAQLGQDSKKIKTPLPAAGKANEKPKHIDSPIV